MIITALCSNLNTKAPKNHLRKLERRHSICVDTYFILFIYNSYSMVQLILAITCSCFFKVNKSKPHYKVLLLQNILFYIYYWFEIFHTEQGHLKIKHFGWNWTCICIPSNGIILRLIAEVPQFIKAPKTIAKVIPIATLKLRLLPKAPRKFGLETSATYNAPRGKCSYFVKS